MSSYLKTVLVICAVFVLILAVGFTIWYLSAWKSTETISESNKTPEVLADKPQNELKQKGEYNAQLQAETDALLPLFERMPSVPIFIVDEPIRKGTEGKDGGVAYNVCLGKTPTIYVKRAFYDKANKKQLVNILKHELTHAFFCRQGIQAGHDARFRKKFKEVGGYGN